MGLGDSVALVDRSGGVFPHPALPPQERRFSKVLEQILFLPAQAGNTKYHIEARAQTAGPDFHRLALRSTGDAQS